MGKRTPLPPPRTVSVADAVSEAFGELSALGEEMRDWASNMEEKFSSTDKYARVDEAASTLEGLSEPDVADSLSEVKVTIQDPKPKRRGYSRADRCAQACSILDAAMSALEDFANSDDPDTDEDAAGEADTLRDELDNLKSEAEGVEFPGMYG